MDKKYIEFFAKYIYDTSGIEYRESNFYQLERRLESLRKDYGLETVQELYAKYQGRVSSEMHSQLLDLSTNNETSFFRDNYPFTALKKDILPKLKEANLQKKTINVWSAASSMGQEPYSIIMTLLDDPDLSSSWTLRVDATDISELALKRTKDGLYSQLEVQRGLPIKKLIKYFDKLDDGSYGVKSELKKILSVKHLNLFTPFNRPFPYDIVFLRNVLIYQNVENKQKILTKIFETIAPGGYLFIGSGESMIGIENSFERMALDKCTVFKKPSLNAVESAA